MGKIIITERQYEKIKNVLIRQGINNNLIKEAFEMSSDGMSMTVDSDDAIGPLNPSGGKIKGGSIFKKNDSNKILCTDCKYTNKKNETFNLNIEFFCKTNSFYIQKTNQYVQAGDTVLPGLRKLCDKKNPRDLNWGGNESDSNKYWNNLIQKLKNVGISVKEGNDKSGPFMYFGPIVIRKDYKHQGGFNIIYHPKGESPTYYKFTDYKNRFAGQPLNTINITDKSGTITPISELIKKETDGVKDVTTTTTPKSGGSYGGTETGGTETGGTETGGAETGGGTKTGIKLKDLKGSEDQTPFSGEFKDFV